MTYSRQFTGTVNKAPSGDEFTNNSGSSLSRLTPVSIDSNGNVNLIDITDENLSTVSVGIVAEDTLAGQDGDYVTNGTIKDVSLAFDFGDSIFVSPTGGLTNVNPDVGVGGFAEGDFVIFVGVLAKNKANPLKKDLLVNIDIRAQL